MNPAKWSEMAVRTVVGVDPPASVAGTCGIVVCGLAADDNAYVLADMSARGLSHEGWAGKAAAAAAWGADLVVAEKNNGGADELCGLTWDGRYLGPGTSPDRADAMVWAMTELMLGPRRAEPRIVAL
jgi:phage terminase large subunit-like protein